MINRVSFKKTSEKYGYLHNNSNLDKLKIGDVINTGDTLYTSNGFDEYGNKMNGADLVTIYLACDSNMEDSVILSEEVQEMLAVTLLQENSLIINDNDILLNRYGDDTRYKSFPDIGEHTKDGIFCSIRRVENDTALYSLTKKNLKSMNISDRNILMDGTIADINVYCNNVKALQESYYNQQLYFYHEEYMRFCRQIVDLIDPHVMKSDILSYELDKLYSKCRDTLNGKLFVNNSLFNYVCMEISIVQKNTIQPGDKLCDRHGGKGVVSKILPNHLMPVLEDGTVVQCIKNQSTCMNRENIGQLHELSINFISARILEYFKLGVLSGIEMVEIWYRLTRMIDPNFSNFALSAIDFYDEAQCIEFIDSIIEDGKIIISDQPFTTMVNINTIREIYKEFPWIKQYKMYVPLEDSNGNIRHVLARRSVVAALIYNYRLKQYGEEKFSCTSLAATNLKNLNTRATKSSKNFEIRHKKTPIMFGNMETADMIHLGMEHVVMNLMLYSASPQARRLFEKLLIGNPYSIDIKLDRHSKNRNVEIINALLKTMGLKLVFRKIPKKKKNMVTNTMVKYVSNSEYIKKHGNVAAYDKDMMKWRLNAAKQNRHSKRMVNEVMVKNVKRE